MGIYWDRNNSLLASFVATDGFYEKIRLNIYPGIIKVFSISPGIFASVGGRGRFTFGMTLSVLPLGICGHYPR